MAADRPIAHDVTDDAILGGRLRLLQPRKGHRFGHDAILLAACTPAQSGERVAEFGAGVGAASLAVLARVPGTHVTLIEVDAALCALARENIARNDFDDRARVVHGDVMSEDVASLAKDERGFQHVLMNPPFNPASLQPSPDAKRRQAHAAGDELLANWTQQAARLLCDHGMLTLIWRAEAEDDVIATLQPHFPALGIIKIHPAPGRGAIRIIVRAEKTGERQVRQFAPLTLMNADQRPSEEAEAIMRHLGAWPSEASNK